MTAAEIEERAASESLSARDDLAAERDRLIRECAGRDLGPDAEARLVRLLTDDDVTVEDVRKDRRELAHLGPVRPSPHPDPATTARFEELAAERFGRVDAHVERIEREGRRLGALVARHEATFDDALARLDRLVRREDPESSVPLVPFGVGVEIAEAAFVDGFDSVERAAS